MAKKTKLDPDDLAFFYKAMGGVKPLIQKKTRLTTQAPLLRRSAIKIKPTDPEPLFLHENKETPPVQSEEFIAFKQVGVSNKILRKLRKGQYNVDAILDLHGMSIDKAHVAVDHFLQQCLCEALQVVLIIHGKGSHNQMPILKNKLNLWLRDLNVVLAFCSALPQHGSRGAIYVLLKRKRGIAFE